MLPPESKKPNRSFLQAQRRIFLDRTDASARGLPFAADPECRTRVGSVARASPTFRPEVRSGSGGSPRPVANLD